MNIDVFADMAKISLTDTEQLYAETYITRLKSTFDDLAHIDTEGIKPMYTVLDLENILREDEPVKLISRETLLSGAPEQYNGYFQVPKAVEG